LPGLYLNGITDCQIKLLVNFGQSILLFYFTIITLISHLGFSYVFVIRLDWGISGTGFAGFLSSFVNFVAVFAYSFYL